MMKEIIITIDIDWAPDFIIEAVADMLIENNVKATWFITHYSPVLRKLRAHSDLFELGVHPNFLPNSSHGSTSEAVIDYCKKLVPEAKTVRTHALVQSTQIMAMLCDQGGMKNDVSLFTPAAASAVPHDLRLYGKHLRRIPYVWADDYEIQLSSPCFDLGGVMENLGSPVILGFHPIFIFLNASIMEGYWKIKEAFPRLEEATQDFCHPLIENGVGVRRFFQGALAYISENQGMGYCIDEWVTANHDAG